MSGAGITAALGSGEKPRYCPYGNHWPPEAAFKRFSNGKLAKGCRACNKSRAARLIKSLPVASTLNNAKRPCTCKQAADGTWYCAGQHLGKRTVQCQRVRAPKQQDLRSFRGVDIDRIHYVRGAVKRG